MEPAQQATLLYVVPIFVVLVTCSSPFIVLKMIGTGTLRDELEAATTRKLTLMSFGILALSLPLFLSNYAASNLYLYVAYGVMLCIANILVERIGKPKVLPFLLVWHAFNLLNLLGGNFGFLQIYSTGNAGIIIAAFRIAGMERSSCPRDFTVAWCNDVWIALQVVISFFYLLFHIVAFLFLAVQVMLRFNRHNWIESHEPGTNFLSSQDDTVPHTF